MIKCDLGVVAVKGPKAVIVVELTTLLHTLYEKNLLTKEDIKWSFDTSMRDTKEVEEEVKQDIDEHKKKSDDDLTMDLLRILLS